MTTDERLDQLVDSMTAMRQELRDLTGKVSGVGQDVRELTGKVSGVETDLRGLTRYVLDMRTEIIGRLDILDSRLMLLTGIYGSLEAKITPVTKAVLELGEISHRMQIEQSRIARLVQPAA